MYCGGDCPNPPPVSDKSCKVNGLCVLVQYLKMMNCANAALCWACVLLLFPLFRIFKATVMQFVVFFLNFVAYLNKNVK